MTLSALRKLARRKTLNAVIISDGCRDYVVEVQHANGAGMLRDWRGRIRRYKALAEAQRVLRSAGVTDVALSVRIAADEACAGPALTGSGFSRLSLSQ